MAIIVSVCLPGEGRGSIETGRTGTRFILLLGEERFPCNGFQGVFWGMEGGGWPSLLLSVGPGPGSTASSPGLVLQQRGASP